MFIDRHITTDFTGLKNHYYNYFFGHNNYSINSKQFQNKNYIWSPPSIVFSTLNNSQEFTEKITRKSQKTTKTTKTTKKTTNKSKNNKTSKMPPITEKRSPSLIKGNVKENFPSANSTATMQSGNTKQQQQQQPLSDKIDNRVPEIIDFRDSWLQEIEMYKDQIKAQQQQFLMMQQQQHQHHHHHHQHTHLNDGTLTTIGGSAGDASFDTVKRRVRTRSDSDSLESNHHHRRLSNESDDGVRAREDNSILSSSPSSSNNKNKLPRHDANNRHSKTIRNRKRKSPSPSSTTTSTASTKSVVTPVSQSPPFEQNQVQAQQETTTIYHKVIANHYHASLLSNSQHKEQLEKHRSTPVTSSINNNNYNTSSSASSPSAPLQQQSRSNSFSNNDSLQKSPTVVKSPQLSYVAEAAGDSASICSESATAKSTKSTTTTADSLATSSSGISKGVCIKGQREEPSYMTENYELDDEDDEILGGIDEADIYDSSDNDDDEYVGYAYYLYLGEERDKIDTTTNTHYKTPKVPLSPSLFPNVPPFINFSSHAVKGPPLPTDIQKILKWKLSNVMPKIVRKVVSNSGIRLIRRTNDWMGTWDKHIKGACFKTIRSHQKFNHLPGTFKIGRKDSVWRNLSSYISRHGRKEFGFMPKTYILPQDLDQLKKAWPKYYRKNTKWIIKPPASARGTGIKVINRWSQIPKQTPLIVQKYIERPLLIEGSKFDLRLYVVVTSINPLRIFLHTDGLARFASVQYSDKLDTLNDRCMHLTNYSINKLSSNYAKNEDINACQGHKWTLKSLWSYFQKRGINIKRLWATLRNLVIRTIISGESCLNKMMKQNVSSKYSCYELFGFDVILDENLIPWLLEVNISPSLHSELPLDQHIKGPLIQAVLNTAMYQVPPKLSEQIEKQVLEEMNLKGPLCYDKRIFTASLSAEELRKHNSFTNRQIEDREDYLDTILDDLTPDDVRCLMIAEDELARSAPLERIFPGPQSHIYLNFIEGPRYYNRLLDAWETKYANNRRDGINLLRKLCENGFHLQVPPAVLARNSEERIESLQDEEQQQREEENAAGIANNLIRSDSQLSIISATIQEANSVDDATTKGSGTISSSATVVSCSKEAATILGKGGVVKAADSENQLNNGPRAIVVEIQ